MLLFYYSFLFLLTFAGGFMPIVSRRLVKQSYLRLLLTFSASFLLGITFLHLIPDAVETVGGGYAGLLMLLGFWGQQLVQRWTHGVEHGHHSFETHHHHKEPHADKQIPFWPVFWGLAIHAFSEGLPLGIHYVDALTLPSLILAIGLHKIPEAMLIITLFLARGNSKKNAVGLLVLFAAVTPLAALAAVFLGHHFTVVAIALHWIVPIVAGVFIQIATTIFYESGTQGHALKWKKWLMVAAGAGIAMLSLL